MNKEKSCLMGIDLGTSSLKTVVFDTGGRSVTSASASYPLIQPNIGWAEQQPEDWFDAAVTTVRSVIEKCRDLGICADNIAGIGISGQMHGGVFLDENGKVIRRAILWCDGRTGEECRQINKLISDGRLAKITGNNAIVGFTAESILWLRNNEPEAFARLKTVLLPKDYLRYRMTGAMALEISDASGTNLLDIESGEWSSEILSALKIDRSILPDICQSSEAVGKITAEFAALTGLREGIPVVGGAADNAAAAVGMGCVSHGKTMLTVGTSGVILAHSKAAVSVAQHGIHLFCSAIPNEYLVLSSTLCAAQSLKWFCETFCGDEKQYAEKKGIDFNAYIEQMAGKAPAGSNRLIFLPHLMGGRSPSLNKGARGVFFGLSVFHKKSDMLRSVMEGVVFSLREYYELMNRFGISPDEVYACGGGVKNTLWRQIFADNFGVKLITADNREGPALGAAILAAVGSGIYRSVPDASAAMSHPDGKITMPQQIDVYDDMYTVYKTLYPALKAGFAMLN